MAIPNTQTDNTEQLKKLAKVFNADKIITSDEINQVLEGIIAILASYKRSTDQVNEETKSLVTNLLDKVEQSKAATEFEISAKKDSTVSEIDTKKESIISEFNSKIDEVKSILDTVRAIKIEKPLPPKEINKDEIVRAVMKEIKLPEYKIFELTGENVIASINALDTNDDELKIDWKHIKNIPKNFGNAQNQWVGSPIRYISALEDYDGTTLPTNGQVPVWNTSTNKWTPGTVSGGGGGTWGSITGTLSDQTDLQTALDTKITNNLGRSGGSTIIGGVASAENLSLSSTSHATKGDILFGTGMVYDETNNRLAMGTATGAGRINLPDAGSTLADGITQGDIAIYRSAATTMRIGSTVVSTRYISFAITGGAQTIMAAGSALTPALILATTQTGTPILTLGSTNNVATLTRNVNDANTVFTLTQTHASSTGNIQDWANSSGVVSAMTRAGNLAIGATSTVASAALEIVSTTKGLLIPRMTTAQRTAIASPAEGLHVYDLTLNAPYYYNGTSWVAY